MTIVNTYTVDKVVATDDTNVASVVVDAAVAGKERIACIVVSNVNAAGGAKATLDISRYDVGTSTNFYGLGKTIDVEVGKPVVLRDILLKAGKQLRLRASAANTLHVAADYFEQEDPNA